MKKRNYIVNATMSAADFRRNHTDQDEHDLQSLCIEWFDMAYSSLLIYAIPNGGYRPIATAKKMKKEGVRRGIPDLHLPVARGEYLTLYIETKTQDGKVSDAQITMHALLRALGHCVIVPRTFEEFQSGVTEYLNQ